MRVVCVEDRSNYSIEGRGNHSGSEIRKLNLLPVKQGRAVFAPHSHFEQSKVFDLL